MNKVRLAIDHGNTRLKATVFRGDEVVESLVLDSQGHDAVLELAERHPVSSAIYASTAGIDSRLVESLQRMLPDGCRVLTASLKLPIGIDYLTPATLGADRLAAAVGAHLLYHGKNILVVDAGTCITLDIVSGRCFRGGNISPGISMRLRAMHDYSAALPKVSPTPAPEVPFGRDTTEALRCGALQGVVGEVMHTYRIAADTHDVQLLVLTGGDAALIASRLSMPCEINTDLVMTGLLKILQYNESI